MAKSTSPVSDVAGRYAGSLFELALEQNVVEKVESDLDDFEALLSESADLKRLIESPVFSADDQYKAISAVVARAGMSGLVGNFLRVVARNRRLFAVPGMIKAFRAIAAEQRGEPQADDDDEGRALRKSGTFAGVCLCGVIALGHPACPLSRAALAGAGSPSGNCPRRAFGRGALPHCPRIQTWPIPP